MFEIYREDSCGKPFHIEDDSVKQLLMVRCTGGSCASAEYYIRGDDGSFILDCGCDAFIGRNGVGKTREGDGRTPSGELGIRRAFGIEPDPGTDPSLKYLRIDDSIYACDEEGPYYNTIISRTVTGHDCLGEHMIDYRAEYALGLETDFNEADEYPKGSAIFIHCKGVKSWTGGCVALDHDMMRRILITADSGLKVCIG